MLAGKRLVILTLIPETLPKQMRHTGGLRQTGDFDVDRDLRVARAAGYRGVGSTRSNRRSVILRPAAIPRRSYRVVGR